MKTFKEKLSKHLNIIPVYMAVSFGIISIPIVLGRYSWASKLLNDYPLIWIICIAPIALFFVFILLFFIIGGAIDLLEHYHFLRQEGHDVDKAFFKVMKILIFVVVVMYLTAKFN